jgi:hypothetical protein
MLSATGFHNISFMPGRLSAFEYCTVVKSKKIIPVRGFK